jgi:hypothetical protein
LPGEDRANASPDPHAPRSVHLDGPVDSHQVPRCALGLNAAHARSGPPPGGLGAGRSRRGSDDVRPKRRAAFANGGVLVSRLLQRWRNRMCHARQAKAAHPRSMDVPTSRSKTGFGVKGERFTPKAGHDPGIVSPEAGSRFCAERTPRHPRGLSNGVGEARSLQRWEKRRCHACRHWARLTSRRHDARLREGMRRASWILRSLSASRAAEPERQPRHDPERPPGRGS